MTQFITCLSSGGLTLDMNKDVLIKKRALREIGTDAGAISADVQVRHVMLGTDPVLSYSLLSKVSADLFDFARGRIYRELEDELTSWKCTVDMMSSVPPDPSSATIADIRVKCRSITRMTITQNGLLLYGLTSDCACAGDRDPSQSCDRPICDYRATLKTFRVPYDTEVKEYGRGGKTRTVLFHTSGFSLASSRHCYFTFNLLTGVRIGSVTRAKHTCTCAPSIPFFN